MEKNQSVVVDYNPQWPEQFLEVKSKIYPAVKDLIMAFEHVGSTSVPGLAAKPILDIDIIFDNPSLLPTLILRLEGIGYIYEGDRGIAGRESFRAPVGSIPHHLYACRAGSLSLRNHIILRNHLLNNPEDREKYGDLKKKIAPLYETSVDDYVEAKTGFILDILKQYSLTSAELSSIGDANSTKR
ncbi:dephospho-CoA kinase/protein folding accessory domain-containing protein [compost metagenome]